MITSHIITITFSPAIDKSASVPLLIPEKKLTCTAPVYEPGGGGINVARAIKRLGGNAIAIYPAGGYTGKLLTTLLTDEKVDVLPIETKEHTRENITIKETVTNNQYRFGMPGVSASSSVYKKCLKLIEQQQAPAYIVVSGSLPPGVPPDIFKKIAEISQAKNARLIVDTSGEALKQALKAGVYLIKPNLKELANLSGLQVLAVDDAERAAKEVLNKYKCEVIVTSLGAEGAFLVTPSMSLKIKVPTVKTESTVGAGDSMLAGIVYSLFDSRSLTDAARYGVACGTAATMNPGTELCHLKDVEKLYQIISQNEQRHGHEKKTE
ncbi:6-phosphofructokinase 2 [Pedobacter africanus]|uniref:6-phosphofructokinase 2 n=1 Tax=Pedobacter africanus TaxID=151894 RepID=A0ACC6KUI3_9SPHI|nr:1-phosphofructokinase family hexose kinase [Pedobacter africanus]MDR6782789.1 6-phosphofructokinase 2 [Pedobacter africanus]